MLYLPSFLQQKTAEHQVFLIQCIDSAVCTFLASLSALALAFLSAALAELAAGAFAFSAFAASFASLAFFAASLASLSAG